MSQFDEQYLKIVGNVIRNGDYSQNRTGIATYKLPHQMMQFDLEEEFPILKTKKVAFKTAIRELFWIYRDQSNDVTRLQEQNVHIWDEWVDENNTIGKGYGYQIAQFKQIDHLIDSLRSDPQCRRMIMDMWNIQELPEMTLLPCCFMTLWDVSFGRLNCMLIQRSGDLGLGIPFNTTQYAVLVHLLAQVTGLKPGLFTHMINNAHVYENHIEVLNGQIAKLPQAFAAPVLWINPQIRDFYDFTIDDVRLENYQSHETIRMGVAI